MSFKMVNHLEDIESIDHGKLLLLRSVNPSTHPHKILEKKNCTLDAI